MNYWEKQWEGEREQAWEYRDDDFDEEEEDDDDNDD